MKSKEAVLLVNLGSPKKLDKKSVREYLDVFLSDDYVVDIPKFLQQLILKLFILPFRPKQTLHAYEQIWTNAGSPLIISTLNIKNKLIKKTGWHVEIAMRYEDPSIELALNNLKLNGFNKIYVVPLYPHNAMATTITTKVEVEKLASEVFPEAELNFIKPFYKNEKYIKAISKGVRKYLLEHNFDKLIFSYHGIPKRQARKTDETGSHCFESNDCCEVESLGSADCYKAHTVQSSILIAKELGLKTSEWEIAYQSRIGPGWLTPFTDKRLEVLPSEGAKSVGVLCPSFISDCLETLEEIDIRGRKTFMDSGGEKMTYIPCLNDSNETIDLLVSIVEDAKKIKVRALKTA
ncbi:ferrochelatase [Acidimicrobiaceae bacterium]|nr:ferrochelatase [Acidimicrobiaceae bacterium]